MDNIEGVKALVKYFEGERAKDIEVNHKEGSLDSKEGLVHVYRVAFTKSGKSLTKELKVTYN